MMGIAEGIIEYPGGLKVRYFLNEHNDRVILLHLHDLGERLELYDYLYPYFDLNDIAYNALELRGHGESGGALLSIDDCADYLKDIRRFITGNLPQRPLFVMGSGIGALLALRLAQDKRIAVSGLILLSPLVLPVPLKFSYRLCLFFRHFLRNHRLDDYLLPPEEMSGDEEMRERIIAEHSRIALKPSASLIAALQREMKRFSFGSGVDLPALVMFASSDPLVDAPATENILRKKITGDLSAVIFQKKHSLLLEKGRIDILEKIIAWTARKAGIPERK